MDYEKKIHGSVIQYLQKDEVILTETEGDDAEGPVILRFAGKMKSSFAPDIRADLNQYVSVDCPLILDLTELTGISISCINAILDMQLHIDEIHKGSIAIQNVPGSILAQFKRIGLTELMDIK